MTKILLGDRGGVDLAEPVKMTVGQRDKFLRFLRHLFAVVEEESVEEFRSDRLGEKLFMREWSTKELAVLLEFKDNDTVCERLGRTWMSVNIKRGTFIPEFLEWAHFDGRDLVKEDLAELIEKFLRERRLRASERRAGRTAAHKQLGEFEEKLDRLHNIRKTREMMIEAGRTDVKSTLSDLDEEIERTRTEIKRWKAHLASENG